MAVISMSVEVQVQNSTYYISSMQAQNNYFYLQLKVISL